jgi:hypothetical protein
LTIIEGTIGFFESKGEVTNQLLGSVLPPNFEWDNKDLEGGDSFIARR